VEIFCRAEQNIDDNMAHAHCVLVTKAKKTLTGRVILIDFHRNNGCENAPLCNVLRTLPVTFGSEVVNLIFTLSSERLIHFNHTILYFSQ